MVERSSRWIPAIALALASCTANARTVDPPHDDGAGDDATIFHGGEFDASPPPLREDAPWPVREDASRPSDPDAFAPMAVDAFAPPLPGMRAVFFSGHSLININSPTMFAQLSERDGRAVRYQLQMGIGSPMSIRLACPRSGQQADGNDIAFDVLTELRRPGAYDTLILTERHDIVTTILYEASTSMARRFRDAIREGNPSARTFLFESWFNIDHAQPEAFRARQARELVAWQCIASKVNESRGEFAPMLVVPAGQAISEFVGDVVAGRAPGMRRLSDVFVDNVHLTDNANYLIALIHYGVVHQRSPVGLPHDGLRVLSGSPPRLAPETAAYLQALAARTVERTFAEAALSQRSDAECARLIVEPCSALLGAGSYDCRQIVDAWRNVSAPVPMHSGSWCRR